MVSSRRDVSVVRFSGVPVTYPEVGATSWERLPEGYRAMERVVALGSGQASFERSAAALLSWRMHRRAGLRVTTSAPLAVPDAVTVLTIGWGGLSVVLPCRVVCAIDEPARRGFAYGTLPGHPECGEEAFVIDIDEAENVTFTVRAFSRPATALARAGGPLTRLAQDAATRRYLRAMRALAKP